MEVKAAMDERMKSELMQLKLSVNDLRDTIRLHLEDIEASIDLLLPHEEREAEPIDYSLETLRKIAGLPKRKKRKKK